MLKLPSATREYLHLPYRHTDRDGTMLDPTSDTVEAGFSSSSKVAPDTWYTAAWEAPGDDPVAVDGLDGTWFIAKILISGVDGDGDVELEVGKHYAWVRVTDSPERPARCNGPVQILG